MTSETSLGTAETIDTIHYIPFARSAGLADEIAQSERKIAESGELASLQQISMDDFIAGYLNGSIKSELDHYFPPGCKPYSILDLGVGYGGSSIYLASRGHKVCCVEPNPTFCRIIQGLSRRWNLNLEIVNATSEAISTLASPPFDYCLFLGSLHHCDEPALAVANAGTKMKTLGKIILIEPVLRFYRSKDWFFRKLENEPDQLGHYGGHEHIYYAWEYAAMLRDAGLQGVRYSPGLGLRNPNAASENLMRFSLLKRLAKRAYLRLARAGYVWPEVYHQLGKHSVLSSIITAEKPHELSRGQ